LLTLLVSARASAGDYVVIGDLGAAGSKRLGKGDIRDLFTGRR